MIIYISGNGQSEKECMDVDHLQPEFTYLLPERVNPEQNENRCYYLAWSRHCLRKGRWCAATVARMGSGVP